MVRINPDGSMGDDCPLFPDHMYPPKGTATAPVVPACQACGACCTSQDPLWVEVSVEDSERIPSDLLQAGDVQPFAMKMCNGRCSALLGEVGGNVSCAIYGVRPSICRKVVPGGAICMYSLGLQRIPVSFGG